MSIIPSFITGNGSKDSTPGTVEQRRKLANALMLAGSSVEPVQSPWQAAARVAQGLVGGLSTNAANKAEEKGRAGANEKLIAALQGRDPTTISAAMADSWMDPNAMGMLGDAYAQVNAPPEAPKTRDLTMGGDTVTQEWRDGDWVEVGRGPKFKSTPDMVVNNNMKAESAYDVEMAKTNVKTFTSINDEAKAAEKTINTLASMNAAMNDPNFYSGTGASAVLAMKKAAASLGINPDSVASMEQFSAAAKQLALDSMGGSLGSGFSNADRDFVTGQVLALDNTPQGNQKVMAFLKKVNERKMQVAKLAREYARRNGGRFDEGFFEEVSQWAEANPLFPQGTGGAPVQQQDGTIRMPNGNIIRQVSP